MQEFLTILTNFGFPIALSVYLLMRFEKILDGLQKTNESLVLKNSELVTEIRTLKEGISDLREILSTRRGK
jgi:cell division protein FtsB